MLEDDSQTPSCRHQTPKTEISVKILSNLNIKVLVRAKYHIGSRRYRIGVLLLMLKNTEAAPRTRNRRVDTTETDVLTPSLLMMKESSELVLKFKDLLALIVILRSRLF